MNAKGYESTFDSNFVANNNEETKLFRRNESSLEQNDSSETKHIFDRRRKRRRQTLHRPHRFSMSSRSDSFGLSTLLMIIAAGLLALATTFVFVVVVPTRDELQLLQHYDLGYLDVPRLRDAVSIAQRSAFFLDITDAAWNPDTQHTEVAKIPHHNHRDQEPTYLYHKSDQSALVGCEASVVIIRHCEKGSIREHCAHVGFERAVYLATLFGDDSESRWPAPSYIFAEYPGERKSRHKMNFREVETVGPLSIKVGVKIDGRYSSKTVNQLSKEILTNLQSGEMCDKVTVVCWKHTQIAHLAHHLGCGPEQGCPLDYKGSTFDMAWQIKFTFKWPDHSSQKDLEVSAQPLWNIAGSVQPEGFDPLAFSKQSGDYYAGEASSSNGSNHSNTRPHWQAMVVSYPERISPNSHTKWQPTQVVFNQNKKRQALDDGK